MKEKAILALEDLILVIYCLGCEDEYIITSRVRYKKWKCPKYIFTYQNLTRRWISRNISTGIVVLWIQ